MLICGTIAEYHPFHWGHLYHLTQTRQQLPPDTACVAVMSGCFVQRGQPAFFSPEARAEMAVRCGADLVLELPLTACLSSAESFAAGGIGILEALGMVTHFSFGSECGQVGPLLHTAQLLSQPDFYARTASFLKDGISYAAARQKALAQLDPDCARLLSQPNNILGVEYCKALLAYRSSIEPITVSRQGAGHDAPNPDAHFASASFLRSLLPDDLASCQPYMPPDAFAVAQREIEAGRGPYDEKKLELLLLAAGRRLKPEDLAHLPDAAEGLENRLYSALYHGTSLEQCVEKAKSRRYPESRIRRMLMCALLGINRQLAALPPSYIRVLAFNDTGRRLLKQVKSTASLPLLLRPSQGRSFTGDAARQFQLETCAYDIWNLLHEKPAPGGGLFRQSPFYLEGSAGFARCQGPEEDAII